MGCPDIPERIHNCLQLYSMHVSEHAVSRNGMGVVVAELVKDVSRIVSFWAREPPCKDVLAACCHTYEDFPANALWAIAVPHLSSCSTFCFPFLLPLPARGCRACNRLVPTCVYRVCT